MQRPTHDYVARKTCGCVVGIMYDLRDKETGKEVSRWIALGYTVDRMPLREATAALLEGEKCTHNQPRATSEPVQIKMEI